MNIFNGFWWKKKRKATVELSKRTTDGTINEAQKIRRQSKSLSRRPPEVRGNEKREQTKKLEEKQITPTKETQKVTAAIWVKDASEEQIENLRGWVTSQGFEEILEYRDTTLLPRHSDMKEFGHLCRDAEKHKFNFVFVISLKNIDLVYPMNFLIVILGLRQKGVRLISQAEPWIDLSIEDMQMLYMALCLHDKEMEEMSIRSKAAKTRTKKRKKTGDDSATSNV